MNSKEVICDLKDGRKLSGLIIGDQSLKKIIIYCHGFPGSRYEAEIAKTYANEQGVSIIAFDRPGFGLSTHDKQRSIKLWGADIKEAIDQLGVKKISVLGVSGGTPYAISVAANLGDQVEHLGLVSGVSPIDNLQALSGMNCANRLLIRLGKNYESIAVGVCGMIARLWSSDKFVKLWFGALLPSVDKKILQNRKVAGSLQRSYKEALSNGNEGAKHDFRLMLKPWEIDFSKITIPVSIWHGTHDSYVPPAMARDLAGRFQTAKLNMVDGEGHFVIVKILDQVISTITQISQVSDRAT